MDESIRRTRSRPNVDAEMELPLASLFVIENWRGCVDC